MKISVFRCPESLPVIQYHLSSTGSDSCEMRQDSVSDIHNFDFVDTRAWVKQKFNHMLTPTEVFFGLMILWICIIHLYQAVSINLKP